MSILAEFTPGVDPRNTQLPGDNDNGGLPFVTYYFRSHFNLSKIIAGSSLSFSAYIDDGAVFYVNGIEAQRIRMPAVADSQTVATTYPCAGDATCPDEFEVPYSAIPSLVAGDNVVAVEVHNYNLRSADVTFGLVLSAIEPVPRTPLLNIQVSGDSIVLTWSGASVLESANSSQGPWTVVAGAVSPHETVPAESGRYYRLKR
jgi:hypothetical protein